MSEQVSVDQLWDAFTTGEVDSRDFESALRHRRWDYTTLGSCPIGAVVYVPHRGLFGHIREHRHMLTHVQWSRANYTLVYSGMLVYVAPDDQRFSGVNDPIL